MDSLTNIAMALVGAAGIGVAWWAITQPALAKHAAGGQPLSGVIPVVHTLPWKGWQRNTSTERKNSMHDFYSLRAAHMSSQLSRETGREMFVEM